MAEVVTLDALVLGGVRRRFPVVERLALIPSAFDALSVLQRRAGILVSGPETALYQIMGDDIEVTVGVPMDEMLPGFERFEIARARALWHRHRGPLAGLPQVYQMLHAEADAQGLTPTGIAREAYRIIAENDAHNVCDVYLDVE
ncbi:GyrI-like domain-containing protein [Tateyamaria sp. SN6-1]|uniref:GyrI-like domain-containing protein n=1 Tax=Tateyamaria sp. SN6-1 TaxID=3092148 RepID=UPI0039F48CB2